MKKYVDIIIRHNKTLLSDDLTFQAGDQIDLDVTLWMQPCYLVGGIISRKLVPLENEATLYIDKNEIKSQYGVFHIDTTNIVAGTYNCKIIWRDDNGYLFVTPKFKMKIEEE